MQDRRRHYTSTRHSTRLQWVNSGYEFCSFIILWRIDSFLGSDRETSNGTTSAARQQIFNEQEYTAPARELLSKHVAAAKDTLVTI
jgi:hypothetical protein